MSTTDMIAIAGLIVAIVVPLGSLMIFFNERARRSRLQLYDKIDHIEHCLHRLHDSYAEQLRQLDVRVARLEGFRIVQGG